MLDLTWQVSFALRQLEDPPTNSPKSELDDEDEEGEGGTQRKKPRLDVRSATHF